MSSDVSVVLLDDLSVLDSSDVSIVDSTNMTAPFLPSFVLARSLLP